MLKYSTTAEIYTQEKLSSNIDQPLTDIHVKHNKHATIQPDELKMFILNSSYQNLSIDTNMPI